MKSVEEYAAAYRAIVQREVPRAGLSIAVEPGTTATRVTFQEGDGSAFQLDSNRSIGQYNKMNDGLLAELSR